MEQTVELDASQFFFGDLNWSPDSKHLVLRSSSQEEPFEFLLWMLNRENLSIKQLMEDDEREFFIRGWEDEYTINLLQSGVGSGSGSPFSYRYNILTEEIVHVPTPIPTLKP